MCMIERIYLARPRGFCAGVVMAIKAVENAAEENDLSGAGDISVYHAIVHNDTVVGRLERDHALHFVEDLEELQGIRNRLEDQGIDWIPL